MRPVHLILASALWAVPAYAAEPANAAPAAPADPAAGGEVAAEDALPPVNWIEGPQKVDIGRNVAELQVKEGFLFTGADGTQKLLESMGNVTQGNEVGFVASKDENASWFLVFDWNAVGYVEDDDKDEIDPDEILKGISEGTEEANKIRRQRGIPALHVTGWDEKPHYDEKSHNLVWALRAKNDEGIESVNYNMRLLGREGYMSITLVAAPEELTALKPQVTSIIEGFGFKSGKTYAEYRSGDKVAEYGLVGLVAAGAGVAAVKLGLFAALGKFLAKGWKLVIAAIVGIGAGIKKLFGGGRRGPMSGSDQGEPPAQV